MAGQRSSAFPLKPLRAHDSPRSASSHSHQATKYFPNKVVDSRLYVSRHFSPLNRKISTHKAMEIMNQDITHRRVVSRARPKVDSWLSKSVVDRRLILQKKLEVVDPRFFNRKPRIRHDRGFDLSWNKEKRRIMLSSRQCLETGGDFDFAAIKSKPLPPKKAKNIPSPPNRPSSEGLCSWARKKNRKITRRSSSRPFSRRRRHAKKLLSQTAPAGFNSAIYQHSSNSTTNEAEVSIGGLTLQQYLQQKGQDASYSESNAINEESPSTNMATTFNEGDTTGDFVSDMHKLATKIFKPTSKVSSPGGSRRPNTESKSNDAPRKLRSLRPSSVPRHSVLKTPSSRSTVAA